AARLGTDHHEYYCTEADALEVVQDLPFYYDEPFADSSAIPTILVSRMARKSVTVALSADAGDEIFGGYDRYEWILKYYKRINAIPALARQGGAALLRAVDLTRWPRWQDDFVFQKKYEKLQTLLRKPDAQNIFLGASVYFNDRELSDLFKIPPQAGYSAHYCEAMQSAYFDPLSYAMAKDYETYLVDDILQKVDRATMSISLEGREPFLDQHIIEWAAGLPADYKIYNGQRKYILRRIVHQYIPEQIMDRPKMGFAVPIRSWLHQALKPLVDHYFSASFLKQQGIFNEKYLQRISGSYYEKGRENDYKIWFILMFQMWYDKWMRA
ncbi:MAG TPA: asparagine synthase C-terminal domain-containing protein, partial [Puia sp.]|nr:asparagine synthase C-terminal domain-containing protein [Puia sp.]